MSFSSDVKAELAEVTGSSRHCQIAETAGLISMNGQISGAAGGRRSVFFRTENRIVARKCFTLLKKTFNICVEVSARHSAFLQSSGIYTVAVTDPAAAEQVIKAIGMTPSAEDPEDWICGGTVLKRDCCRRAYLRGAYLAAGSMSNPDRGYHLEISCTSQARAAQLQDVLSSFEISARITRRKKHHVVYLKEGDAIVDVLGIMGAHRSLLAMENIRIVREMRETVNRQVNCETANISKTTSAACRQMSDISYIEQKIGLDALPEPLKETAMVRMQRPDASLQELGGLLDPPVGKSGVNHRLRRLKEIADSLRSNEEENRSC